MAHALESTANCTILRSHPQLAFRNGPYSDHVERRESASEPPRSPRPNKPFPSPSCGRSDKARQVRLTFSNMKGPTYESRVSFFNQTQSLDLTIGDARSVPEFLDEAAGRRLSSREAQECFGCHSTAAVSASSSLQVENLIAGVTCEACHGPGAQHVETVAAGRLYNLHIFNPGKLKTGDLSRLLWHLPSVLGDRGFDANARNDDGSSQCSIPTLPARAQPVL